MLVAGALSSLYETLQRQHSKPRSYQWWNGVLCALIFCSGLRVSEGWEDGWTNMMSGFVSLSFLTNQKIISVIFWLVSFDQWGVSIFNLSCVGKIILVWPDWYIDSLVQDCGYSIADSLELSQSNTKPSPFFHSPWWFSNEIMVTPLFNMLGITTVLCWATAIFPHNVTV